MLNQKLLTSAIPSKWQPKYILKRIGDEDIYLSLQTRDAILQQLARNGKYVQIGEYTIMLNAIKSIDPVYGAKNIPPCPKKYLSETDESAAKEGTIKLIEKPNPEYKEWMEIFGDEKRI